jgi:hypothetical protein
VAPGLAALWAGVLYASRAGQEGSLAKWPFPLQMLHVVGQSHLPGVEWLGAPLHLWG